MNDKILSIIIKAQDQASSVMNKVSDNIVSASERALKYGTLALAGGITLAAKASWDQVSAVQQATVGLNAYEGNADKVNKVLSSLVAYARSDMGVLFNRKDLFAAAQSLKIMGDNTDELTDHVKIMSRSVGLGLSTWDDLNRIIGRVGSTGQLTGDDFDNLTKAGYKLDPAMRNTGVTFDTLFRALDKGIPVNAMEGQANTIQGLGIRMETAFRGVGNAILGVDANTNQFIAGGIGDRLTKAMATATDVLKNAATVIAPAMTSFLQVGDAIAARVQEGITARFAQANAISTILMQKFQDGNFEGIGEQITTGLLNGIKTIANRAAELMQAADSLMSKVDWVGLGLTFGSKVLPGVALGILAGLANLDIGALLSGVMAHWEAILFGLLTLMFLPAKWAGWLGGLLGKIPMAGTMLEWGVTHINAFGQGLVAKVFEWLGLMGSAFIDALGLQSPRVIPAIIAFLRNIPDAIGGMIGVVDNRIGQMMISMGDTVAGWGPAQIVRGAQSIRAAISGVFADAGGWLIHAGEAVIQGFIQGLKNQFGNVKGTLGDLTKKLTQWKGPESLDKVILKDSGTMVIDGFVDGLQSAYSKVQGTLSNLTQSLPTSTNYGAAQNPVIQNGNSIASPSVTQQSSAFNIYGNINLGSADAVDSFFTRLNAQKEMGALGVGV